MNKFFKIYSCLVLLTAFVVMFVIGFWLMYPYNPLVIKSNYLPTDKVSYRAGESLSYTLDYCKNVDKTVLVSRAFIDGVVYSLPDITANNTVGCNKVRIWMIVPNLPDGTYKIKISYTYQLNPLREITITTYTNEFQVIKK